MLPPWALVLAVVAVVVVAYALGRRRGTEPNTAAKAAPVAPPSQKEKKKPAEKPEAEEPAASSDPALKKTPEPFVLLAPPSSKDPPSVKVPSPMARFGAEDDDDVDVTRVGATSTPAPHVVLQPPVKRLVFDEDADADEPTHVAPVFLVHATAQTDKGLRRKHNEDSLLVVETEGLFVVADGLGGHNGGARASSLAVDAIAKAFRTRTFEGPAHDGVPVKASELARAIQMANAAILEDATANPKLQGMGTTICAARFSPNKKRVTIGHVGDSRCYRLRDGVLTQMTTDHTMADHGVSGPESGNLSRAVGLWPTITMDLVMAVPQPGDVYLICSDGLTKMLPDTTIGAVLRSEEDPKVAVERLIFFANSKGGKDNITIILVRVVPPNWKPRPSTTTEAEGEGPSPAAEAPGEPTTSA